MGLRDMRAAALEQKASQQAAQADAAALVDTVCTGDHYVTKVNKGSINMTMWQIDLNDMYRRGYRLAHTFEQAGNTVQVYEHHTH